MFAEVAKKYRDVPNALETSIKRVREGSTGVWGKVAMLPHAQHTPEQVSEMVRYVYSIQADSNSKTVGGLNNSIEVKADLSGVQLEAFYTDLGQGAIPALTGSQTIRLRSRVVQAEQVDSIRKATVLNSDRAQGKAFVGAIESGAILQLNGITLTKVGQIVLRVATAGQGGFIEVHRDKENGELIGRVDVAVNGDWEAFSELSILLEGQEGKRDLFFVFKNANGGGGLMNIDSIEFRK